MQCDKCNSSAFRTTTENYLITRQCLICSSYYYQDLPNPDIERLKNIKLRLVARQPKKPSVEAYRMIEWHGEIKSSIEWEKVTGLNRNVIYTRVFKLHWPVEKALTQKTQVRRHSGRNN